DAPPPIDLPTDRPRPAQPGSRGAVERLEIPAALAASLKRLGRAESATFFMTLLAAWTVLLARLAGREEVLVGTPVSSRSLPELEGVVGFLVNTLVVRTDLSGDPAFCEALARLRDRALEAYAHQDLPYERLVEELAPERDLASNPIFQVFFSFQGAAGRELALGPELTAGVEPVFPAAAKFDLSLALEETAGGALDGWLLYDSELFDAATVRTWGHYFGELLAAVAADPEARISSLLPAIPLVSREPAAGRAEPGEKLERPAFLAPRTPVEELLAGFFAEVLETKAVGVHDSFFELGGHSLLATRVVARVRETFGVDVPLRQFFKGPTVAGLAQEIAAAGQEPDSAATRSQPSAASFHELFAVRAAEAPSATAVACAGESLSYGRLDRLANGLAARLRSAGVGPEVRVALMLERSIASVVAVLGVLKAGGAYVPVDSEYPAERVAWLLADSGAEMAVTSADLALRLPAGFRTLLVEEGGESPVSPAVGAGPGNAAYVIYTSGSTGLPKGVVVPH